jgi:hypothetical protein
MMHGGLKNEVLTEGEDWIILWSTKPLKLD